MNSYSSYQKPEWLTIDFLQEVLREHFKDDKLGVSDLVVNPADGPTGFASIMHRASFELARAKSSGKFSVIIKEHPKGQNGVVAHKNQLFKREIFVYKQILPRVDSLLASIHDNAKIAPVCYYATETPEPFIIMEDLKLNNYGNAPRGRLLNLDFLLPTINKVAKLHACSVVIAAENPQIMDLLSEAPISRNPDRQDFLGYYPANIQCAAEALASWNGFEKISEKLLKLSKTVVQNAVSMYESQTGGFRVFNIADLWMDNIMFHINPQTNEPTDAIMVDYQLAFYGSPAVDLNYFLYGSVNENVRKMHFKYIVREYHRVLKETLLRLGYDSKIPTLKDIHISLIQNSLQGVIAATCLTPMIFSERDGFENFENLTSHTEEGDRIRKINFQNQKYRTFLQRTAKELEFSGFLDT